MSSPSQKKTEAKIPRRFGRYRVNAPAMLALPEHRTAPRARGTLVQIGKGGCAIEITAKLFTGESCLVWITHEGHKFLGAKGTIVWHHTIFRDGHETWVVGIEFAEPIALGKDLLAQLHASAL